MKVRISIEPVEVLGSHVHMGVRLNGALSGTLVARVGAEAEELQRVLLQLHCHRDPCTCDLNEEKAHDLERVIDTLGIAQDLVEGADLIETVQSVKQEANTRGDGWAKANSWTELFESVRFELSEVMTKIDTALKPEDTQAEELEEERKAGLHRADG